MNASADMELDEAGLARLAAALASQLITGDCIALTGDLGAGKTTFARAFIRAALGEPDAEVPSPTFPIEQQYDGPQGLIAHYDLYRLSGADELEGIGFNETQPRALTLIEWPQRAEDLLPRDRLDVTLTAAATPTMRRVTLQAHGASVLRVQRALAEGLPGSHCLC